MDGKGEFSWADGRKYIGQYLDDKKQGYGVFQWYFVFGKLIEHCFRPDGRRYEGFWQNGKQHGQGVYYNTQGKRKEGEWNEGKRVRWINESQAAPQ